MDSLNAATISIKSLAVLWDWRCNKGKLLRSAFIYSLLLYGQELRSVHLKLLNNSLHLDRKANVCRTAAIMATYCVVSGLS
jgi:hypothetical protein